MTNLLLAILTLVAYMVIGSVVSYHLTKDSIEESEEYDMQAQIQMAAAILIACLWPLVLLVELIDRLVEWVKKILKKSKL